MECKPVVVATEKPVRRLDDDEGISLIIGILILVLGTAAFIALAHEVSIGATQHFDEWVLHQMRSPTDPNEPIGPPWFQESVRDITALGGYAVMVLLTIVGFGCFWLDGKKSSARLFVGAVVSGYLLGTGLKALFARPRPTAVPLLEHVAHASFPSGHALMSAVTYLTLAALVSQVAANRPRLRFFCILAALAMTGMIGASRVYEGVHYPSDVLGGWTVGLVWATLWSLIGRRLQRPRIVDEQTA
jgi:undecaprenyl-diphosphatase